MELWWWIGPLFGSSFVWACIWALIAVFLYMIDKNEKIPWIILIAIIPLILTLLATVAWLIAYVFWSIWSPYL